MNPAKMNPYVALASKMNTSGGSNNQPNQVQANAKAYATYVGVTILGIGTLVGGYFLLHNRIKAERVKKQQEVIEERGLDAGAPEGWAKRLKMAVDNDNTFGWGTDEEAIYQVFRELPNKRAYTLVQRAFKTLYKTDLNAIIQEELDSKEYATVMAIYNKKPK